MSIHLPRSNCKHSIAGEGACHESSTPKQRVLCPREGIRYETVREVLGRRAATTEHPGRKPAAPIAIGRMGDMQQPSAIRQK